MLVQFPDAEGNRNARPAQRCINLEEVIAMAFNITHWGTINSGASFPVAFGFNGQNRGVQYAQGNPENPNGSLITTDQRIFTNANNATTYQFQLTNVGANTTFTLAGGGLT
jgi:hypothetical protein